MDGSEDERRLGKRELGRYAYEVQMPRRIAAMLAAEQDTNKLRGVVPLLRLVLERNIDVKVAHLCDDDTMQVWKLNGEGNHFCGYRNIQMLVPEMKGKTVLQIQELIEQAWSCGFNAMGMRETGGIAGTRKHIGTAEVQALLDHLHIRSEAHVFSGRSAHREILDWIESYFKPISAKETTDKVNQTTRPPIYLQTPFHSFTVIGFYRTTLSRKLLVFDPGVSAPSIAIKRIETRQDRQTYLTERAVLWHYRMSEWYLKRQSQFEILHVTPDAT